MMEIDMNNLPNSTQNENNDDQKIETKLSIETVNTSPSQQRIKKPPLLLFWSLIPFIRRVFLYFTILPLTNVGLISLPLILRAILQCAPLMTLTVFVFRQFNSIKLLFANKYGLLIFIGHLFAIASAMIIVFLEELEVFFIIGKGLHLVALALYTFAFGFKPFASRLFVRSLIAGCLAYYYLYIGGLREFELIYTIGSGLLIAFVFTLQWRAWARVSYQDLLHGRWYEFLGGLASSLLVIAESVTLVDRFLMPTGVPHSVGAQYATVALLYAANLFLALSVLDGPNVVWPQESAMQKRRMESLKQSLNGVNTCTKTFIIRTADWIFS